MPASSAEQISRLVTTNLIGLAGILTAAYGASTTDSIQTTLAWFNLGLAGLVVAGGANVLHLVRGRAAFVIARADVLRDIDAVVAERRPAAAASTGMAWVEGRRRFHRPGCALLDGRYVEHGDRDRASAGRTACEVCRP